MESALFTPLSAIEQRLNALVTSINSSPTAAGAPAAALALLDADDHLTSALHTLRTHQANYARILQLRAEAQSLEDRVRDIVREVAKMGDEITAMAGDVSSDDDRLEPSGGGLGIGGKDQDTHMGGTVLQQQSTTKNEIDYKLLLDFARRISKYNTKAASAAASGSIPTRQPLEDNQENNIATGDMAAITKHSTSGLDALARSIRQGWMLPYPHDDKIRLGIMGRLQAAIAASEDRDEKDFGKEVEKIILAVEKGEGNQDLANSAVPPDKAIMGNGNGTVIGTVVMPAANVVKPTAAAKSKLDLDLYDPDEDDP
ncbi:hypothetical protein LOZ53_004443 [Ophidiomyces ophidiicola]|uniref:uncharacterized protein n=1 Tax=Ophidiomyces ophidiicola TaxID=1387563 RepID=UPI0020C25644|nr:uncharacterized protein LOZ57_006447 [Ophidiomyces ophidiicola]KAI1937898.1 hypothetical protein LOZ57_006447 [Ophidiomyces ophidiicola]KAI1971487.1 hypothetical protein LOZ55_006170 [Ophidiomyces ophidiicola]KAI1985774.1 hypothetical protein LOZ54_004115 [Ophidiomyces ophidiicola]KAI1987197.1 hypothetical protein LOZ53_004443 [Ophidiomyces ophidiicola]KAI1998574.1 hypothetical protein LOZ51_002305 [Ophidiomyces ophidiicola]